MKRILAIVLSIAILVMAFPFSVFAAEPTVATDTWDGTTTEPTQTDADGNIIINTAEEFAWVALQGGASTEGKSYKVADGIESFDMNGSVGITADSTAADVNSATATDNKWSYSADGKSNAFKGNFDGNGITVFNIRTNKHGYSGLFPFVHNDSTIKNVTLKASYIAAYHYAAGIVGGAEYQKTLNVEKCAVINCYITDAGDTNSNCSRAAAQFVAGTGNSNVNINNCFAIGNTVSATGFEAGFVATSGAWIPTGISVKNSISIGMYPYSTAKIGELGKGLTEQLTVENVYSDVACGVSGFTTLTTDKMQGDAAKSNMALTWNTDWLVGAEGEYPSINFGEPVRDPYVWDGTFKEPTETDAEGNIIINTVQEMAWLTLQGGENTANKNYKVADGVKYFDMNGMAGITLDSTAEQVKNAVKNSAQLWKNDSNYFMGNFDGNGVTVYNINAAVGGSYAYTGLFTVVKPENDAKEINIKNVTVAASYFEGYHYTGGIIGFAQNQSTNTGCVNVDSCATKNCYFYDTVRIHNSTSGLIIGQINHNSGNVSNCLAINNISDAGKINGGIVGTSSDYISTQTVSDCIVIGSLPYSTVVEGSGGKIGTRIQDATVTNVYTDQTSTKDGYTTLANDKMQGAVASITMDTLDNSIWFFNSTTYPELRVFHNITDGKCVDCGLEVAGDPCVGGHTLEAVEGIEASNFVNGLLAHDKCSVCGKTFIDGVEKTAEELVIPMLAKTWNGSFVEPTQTDANGNIVINTPEELAWVALRGGAATEGKNYIVAKDSVFNADGMTGITPFSTVTDVKAAEKNESKKWQFEADNNTAAFKGNFDGNGLIVYNIYTGKGRYAGGLFPETKPNAGGTLTVKNVTVLASHIGGYHYAGGIIGLANAPSTDTKFVLENCVVKNTYIYDNDDANATCQRTTGTLVGNLGHNATNISNCFVANNETSAQGIIGGLFGNSSAFGGAIAIKNVVSVGTSVQPMMVNYTINDKALNATYINVYTDQSASASGITTLTTDEMKGAAATDNMNLNWGINWAAGAEGEYPTIIIDNAFYDEWDGSFVEPTKTDAEGNIIISTAEEMAWVALRGDTATTGKNYKVADGIKYFNMSGMAGITANSTVSDVKNATKDDTKSWTFAADGKVGTFYGNFDGNGVTVYNIYTKKGFGYGGLFPAVRPQSGDCLTIKNVAVVASYIGGYHYAGGIIGYADAPDTSTKLSIENIIVKNSYMYDNNDVNPATQKTTGVVVGSLTHNSAVINNVFASGNELSSNGILGGLFGNSSGYAAASTVSNVILLGTAVEPASVDVTVSEKVANTVYTNVYTDQASSVETVTTLTVDEMYGTKLALDWSGWIATATLPEIRAFHNITVVDNGDGTHSETCDDCDIANNAIGHIAGEEVEENRTDTTCDVAGSYDVVVYCTVCDAEISRKTIEIPTSDHIPADAVEENRVDATCDVAGSYESVVYCSVCDTELSRDTVAIEATGHNYVKTELPSAPSEGTLSFADKSIRTEFSTSKQVWEQNGVKLTNNKAASTSNIADYANPARFYANTEVIIEFAGMTKLVINCTSENYANAWLESISDSNAVVTIDGSIATITFTNAVDSFTIATMSGQTRVNSVTAYGAPAAAGGQCLVCENCGDTRELPNYGDANGDSTINNKDLALLMQYINGYDVEVDTTTVDVNLDGKVNNKDYVLIMRYINGWAVELG